MTIDFGQYSGESARSYLGAQEEFYSGRCDDSRGLLYSFLDVPLKDRVVLDAGCGFGQDVAYLYQKGCLVSGIDVSSDMIKLAKEKYPFIQNFDVADFSETFFEDLSFDTIFSRYALQYVDDLDLVYQEFFRILKPGGDLVLLVAHPLLGFVAKDKKNYYEKEVVEIPIYEGEIKVDHWGLTATKDGEAKLSQTLNVDIKDKKVLIIDDITDTGQSMETAIQHIQELQPKQIQTATLIHLDNSKYTPNFYGHKQPWAWIIFPWNLQEDLVNLTMKLENLETKTPETIKQEMKEKFALDLEEEEIKETLEHINYLKNNQIL